MSASFRLSERAAFESLEIYLFGIEHFGPRQASHYLAELEDCIALSPPTRRWAGLRRAWDQACAATSTAAT